METVHTFVNEFGLLVTAIIGVIGLVTTLIARVKSLRVKDFSDLLLAFIRTEMVEAENVYTDGETKGENKLTYVLAKCQTFCKEHNIPFDADKIRAYVESLIGLANNVNKRL